MDATGKLTVLTIEDQQALRSMYRAILTSAGYEVLEAEDGEAGWQLAREGRPDLVLLDLRLPKLSGYEVLERIRADETTRDIPVVIFSAAGTPKDIQKGLELGADDYAVKGLYAPKQLLVKIRSVLAARQTRQSAPSYRLSVTEGRGDAAKLEQDMGLTKLFRCPQCEDPLALELIPDPTRTPGHWFVAHFVSPKCGRSF